MVESLAGGAGALVYMSRKYGSAYSMARSSTAAMSAITAVRPVSLRRGSTSREAGNRSIPVQGGMGFTWENNVHLYYKRDYKRPRPLS